MIKAIVNPIKDNRIVSDYTFATRFLNFLKDFYPDAGGWDQISQEEYEYLCLVAKELLDYQFQTCNYEEEHQYLKNISSIEYNNDKQFRNFLNILQHGR